MVALPVSRLTDRQQSVLDFWLSYWFEYGIPPTLRELARFLQGSSPNAGVVHIRALVKKGCLARLLRPRGVPGGVERSNPFYVPLTPQLLVQADRDGVRVGSVGGAIAFTRAEWQAWLLAQLAELSRSDASGADDKPGGGPMNAVSG